MTELTERFDQALVYASAAHRAQRRKGSGTPYVAHLLGVAAIALEAGADQDMAIAALLHDTVEDQGGAVRLADIGARFGGRVAGIVADCSDSIAEGPDGAAPPKAAWRQRKEAYIASLAHKREDSLFVSLCDKIYNAEAILADLLGVGDDLWGRFTGGRAGVLWYYRALAEAFERRLPGRLATRLSAFVRDMHAHAGEAVAPVG